MASGEALSQDELLILGHYRRLAGQAEDFKLEIFGGRNKHRQRTVQIRPTAYYELVVPSLSDRAFQAVD